MPVKLADPVLRILRREALAGGPDDPGAAAGAGLQAYDLLQGCSRSGRERKNCKIGANALFHAVPAPGSAGAGTRQWGGSPHLMGGAWSALVRG